jgi:hypothetical protein
VFGHDGVLATTWANNLVADLRVDFHQPTDFAAIDIVGNDVPPTPIFDPGFLQAFDASDTLLGTFTTLGTLGAGVVETATISTGTPIIAYVIASG